MDGAPDRLLGHRTPPEPSVGRPTACENAPGSTAHDPVSRWYTTHMGTVLLVLLAFGLLALVNGILDSIG